MAKLFSLVCALFLVPPAMAGSSGYIQNGKVVKVYENGQKVGEWPKDSSKNSRAPSSARAFSAPNERSFLMFEEDDLARCYFFNLPYNGPQVTQPPMNCVRK